MCGSCLFITFVEAFINVLGGSLTLLIFTRALFTWIPGQRLSAVRRFVFDASEPILAPIRRLPAVASGPDFSPLVAFVLIQVATIALLRILPPAV
jgi:uncharacterized protein YggT (Ycf19 family)